MPYESHPSIDAVPHITYAESLEDVTPEKLVGFFEGWPNRPTPETHLKLLNNSSHYILARNQEGGVVGFITANTDGVLSAHISFLEVLPGYQDRGIGSELLTRMLDKLKHIYAIDLLCDPELQPFYEKAGMQKAVGMQMRTFDKQKGDGSPAA